MKNDYYVYAHYTKTTNELFYIGKGRGNRATTKNKRNKYWKNVVKKHGLVVKYIKCNLTEKEAFKIEIKKIKKLNPKCNMTKGGEGHTAPCHKNTKKAVKNYWASMSKDEKSKEQKRRNNLKIRKKVKCLNNGKIYKNAHEALKDLKLTNVNSIYRVARGVRNHYKNYKFEYVTSK